MNAEALEALVAHSPDPSRRATAYAALTLTRILAPVWTHVVPVRDPKTKAVRHETITKPAGEIVGDRKTLETWLATLLDELSCQEGH